MSSIILETPRLVLRTWNKQYGELLGRYCNTDEVMMHLGGRQSPKKHQETVTWLIDQQIDYGFTFWVMEAKEDNEFLGFCGLVRVDEPDSTVLGAIEIGWRLKTEAQGKKFAKEAAQACLKYAFEKTDGLRVVSRTTPSNNASWGLMKSLGMRHDPRLDYKSDGEDEGYIVFVRTYDDH